MVVYGTIYVMDIFHTFLSKEKKKMILNPLQIQNITCITGILLCNFVAQTRFKAASKEIKLIICFDFLYFLKEATPRILI